AELVERGFDGVVEGRLMRLVADGVNRHAGRKLARLDVVQIGLVVVASLQHRQGGLLGKHADIVEMGRLVGDLPGRRIQRIEGNQPRIGPNDPEERKPARHGEDFTLLRAKSKEDFGVSSAFFGRAKWTLWKVQMPCLDK